ncbi:UDP-N-acetylmuramoyl-L-alanyl-D-glutamate--2 6-diaminopimelate ligase, partial [termite gut metagenome]
MELEKLLSAIRPIRITGNREIEITGINIDSRLIEKGHLFIAVKGTQVDGHTYIPAAIEKGAVAVVCENLPDNPVAGITYVHVTDSEDAVGRLATIFYGDPTSKLKLVGVTGTNGKTT